MCPAGLKATEEARWDGRASATCPRTKAVLRCGEFGIWYVAEPPESHPEGRGSILLPADAIGPPAHLEPIRAPGAERAITAEA